MRNDIFDTFVARVGEVITPTSKQVKDSIWIIQNHVEQYVVSAGLKSLVVGVSGGLDSAVTAAIVAPICKRNGIKLIGVSIPLSSSKAHIEQAYWVGKTYCDAFMQMDEWETEGSHAMVDKTMKSLDKVATYAGFEINSSDTVAQGNIKARLRMMSLYHVAGITGGAVLSTDNFSEGWLGFWTLHGDVGDVSPIQYIEKGWEEPEFARALGVREDIITQNPSDGLSVTEEDSDEAQLGMNYKKVGAVIFGYEKMLPEKLQKEYDKVIRNLPKVQDIINRHKRTQFKRDGVYEVKRNITGLPTKF